MMRMGDIIDIGVDAVEVLPKLSPVRAKESVVRKIEALVPEGYVVSATYNVQPDASLANVSAIPEATRDYPLGRR